MLCLTFHCRGQNSCRRWYYHSQIPVICSFCILWGEHGEVQNSFCWGVKIWSGMLRLWGKQHWVSSSICVFNSWHKAHRAFGVHFSKTAKKENAPGYFSLPMISSLVHGIENLSLAILPQPPRLPDHLPRSSFWKNPSLFKGLKAGFLNMWAMAHELTTEEVLTGHGLILSKLLGFASWMF